MRLSDHAVLFDFHGLPVLGSETTGAVIGLSPAGCAVCRALAREGASAQAIAEADPQLLAALQKGGFLKEYPAEVRTDTGAPSKSAYVHVTQRCNLRCFGCYSENGHRNRLADPSADDLARAFRMLADWGAGSVVLSGGEPFLRPDLADVCQAAKEAGIDQVTVLTNGLLVTKKKAAELAGLADCISISFDGTAPDAPAFLRGDQRFDDLCAGIGAIAASGIRPHIIATIHRRNVEDIPAYVELARQLGATINFSLLSCCEDQAAFEGLVHDEDSLERLGSAMFSIGTVAPEAALDAPLSLNLTLRSRCGAASDTLSIDGDGTVYPCHMMHRPELAMGNAFTATADSIRRSAVAERFAALDSKEFPACAPCEYRRFCGGGCRARAYRQDGTLDAKDPFCTMTRTFYGALGEALAARFLP